MPFHEIETPDAACKNSGDASSSLTFSDIFEQSGKTANAIAREAALITAGTVGGAMNEIQNNPVSTVARAGSTLALGAGLGALAASEVPFLVVGAATTGVVLTGVWMYDTFNPDDPRNQNRFSSIGHALTDVWNHSDRASFETSVKKMQDGIGPIALDVGLMAIGGTGAQVAARQTPRLLSQLKFQPELAPSAVPNYFCGRANTLFLDWSELAYFQKRSSPIRVDKGTPESLPARIEMLNAKAGLSEPQPRSHKFLSLVDKPITPREKNSTSGISFFFSEKAYKNR